VGTGLFLAAAGLLVLAGLQKAADPAPLVRALRSVGLAVPAPLVRLLAVAEVLVGVVSLLTGNGWAVAASYALFTAFVVVALVRGGVLASCGCFGKADTPPTWLHVAVTSGLAVGSLPGRAAAVDLALLTTAVAVAVTAYLTMAVLPLARPPARLR
jgi:hypothetical protein